MRIFPENTYKNSYLMSAMVIIVILVGTLLTMAFPMLTPALRDRSDLTPTYTALQLAGKDIYQRESCVSCHSQNVRSIQSDVVRYVHNRKPTSQNYTEVVSTIHEYQHDRPFLWGSKRTGSDLARVGYWYSFEGADFVLADVLGDPQTYFPASNMPGYAFLNDDTLNPAQIRRNMRGNRFPFTEDEISALADKTEMDALVAYLLTLGDHLLESEQPPVSQ